LKALEKERLQGGEHDNNQVVCHRHIHDPGIQQEPYSSLLATKEMTSRDTGGIGGTASTASCIHTRCSWGRRAGTRRRRNRAGAYRRSHRERLSPRVSSQTERHFMSISTGVHWLARHSISLGALPLFLGTPLLLGSRNGTAMGLVLIVLL